MRTLQEIRDELARHQEWWHEWGGEGSAEEGREWGFIEALQWVLEGEDDYEYGTRWLIPADPDHPWADFRVDKIVDYPEDSLEAAISIIEKDHAASKGKEPRGKIIRRRKAGEWEEV